MAIVRLPVIGAVAPGAFRGDPGAAGALPADPLLDNFARRIRYLRVSVTDRCNYRCSYCMPEELGDRLSFEPRTALLTFEELERVVAIFARLGVRKVRLTGGEPTIRKGIVDLARRLATVAGIEQLVMTTNGHLLDELAVPLVAAGVQTVNISLDTLDSEKFARVTGRGDPGPARYWQLADGRELGIISAMTEHFCDDCNRLRLTATGDLHACLGHDDAISLRDIIRRGGSDDDVIAAIAAAVTGKRAG